MTKIHHINCVIIQSPNGGSAIGHCLLLEDKNGLAMVDIGIGLLETRNPKERIGQELIDIVGFEFSERQTAIRQIEKLGLSAKDVKHCIVSHLDPDHIGGLVDFPELKVHVAKEEYENLTKGNSRYLPIQLAHNPPIKTYDTSMETWFGLEARKVDVDFESDIYLIPLFGHTFGHCGVAVRQNNNWIFYVGDAYYLRVETETDEHSATQLAIMRADSNDLRIKSLNEVKRILTDHKEIEIFGYHDPTEFPN